MEGSTRKFPRVKGEQRGTCDGKIPFGSCGLISIPGPQMTTGSYSHLVGHNFVLSNGPVFTGPFDQPPTVKNGGRAQVPLPGRGEPPGLPGGRAEERPALVHPPVATWRRPARRNGGRNGGRGKKQKRRVLESHVFQNGACTFPPEIQRDFSLEVSK